MPPAAPKMFASMFTMCCFLTFGYCLTTIVYFAADPDASFFIGYWPLLGLLWLPCFGVAHYLHLKAQKPRRSVMMACIFGPAVTYFLMGWSMLHTATRLHTLLRSSDCAHHELFKDFQASALAARKFHNNCLRKTGERLLIQYCPGYDEMIEKDDNEKYWTYLNYAEHNYGCAGWCNANQEPAMWTYQGFNDSCAVALANTMNSKIGGMAFQMMIYSICVVGIFLFWIEVMSGTLKAVERGEELPTNTGKWERDAMHRAAVGAKSAFWKAEHAAENAFHRAEHAAQNAFHRADVAAHDAWARHQQAQQASAQSAAPLPHPRLGAPANQASTMAPGQPYNPPPSMGPSNPAYNPPPSMPFVPPASSAAPLAEAVN